ncbi:hypothetical protein [Microbulbifer sp. SAOS-129_SWC]|uniref:hypothetical protein n=1 Tax=Microbulbifer sp. SAOS-129_SWC TaxID=3145235 RepID=UPI0032178F89
MLQSVLLCAAVQAEPGATKSLSADSCAALLTLGDDTPFPNTPDNDTDLQSVDEPVTVPASSFAVFGFLPPRTQPQSCRIDSNSIRGPPSLA